MNKVWIIRWLYSDQQFGGLIAAYTDKKRAEHDMKMLSNSLYTNGAWSLDEIELISPRDF